MNLRWINYQVCQKYPTIEDLKRKRVLFQRRITLGPCFSWPKRFNMFTDYPRLETSSSIDTNTNFPEIRWGGGDSVTFSIDDTIIISPDAVSDIVYPQVMTGRFKSHDAGSVYKSNVNPES